MQTEKSDVLAMEKQAHALLIVCVSVHGDQWGMCALVFGVCANFDTSAHFQILLSVTTVQVATSQAAVCAMSNQRFKRSA